MKLDYQQLLFDRARLAKQLSLQHKYAWNLDQDIPWELGIDTNRYFLALDEQAIAFRNASAEQRLVLSQWMGMIVNQSIAEMETAACRLKEVAWRTLLKKYCLNPEFEELGEQFFAEELKHAEAFRKFAQIFSSKINLDYQYLKQFLPSAESSHLLNNIKQNAQKGGLSFWWLVAMVEEESVLIFQHMHPFRKELDPLFYKLHQKHFEEESRHESYAFLMLEHLRMRKKNSLMDFWHRKTDLLATEIWTSRWVVQELSKSFLLLDTRPSNEFLSCLVSCLKLFNVADIPTTLYALFSSSPYISSMLNRRYHKKCSNTRKAFGALGLSYPQPKPSKLMLSKEIPVKDPDKDASYKKPIPA